MNTAPNKGMLTFKVTECNRNLLKEVQEVIHELEGAKPPVARVMNQLMARFLRQYRDEMQRSSDLSVSIAKSPPPRKRPRLAHSA
jgi:hypothetical protein